MVVDLSSVGFVLELGLAFTIYKTLAKPIKAVNFVWFLDYRLSAVILTAFLLKVLFPTKFHFCFKDR